MDFTTARSHDNLAGKRMMPVLSHSISHPASSHSTCLNSMLKVPTPDKNSNHLSRFAKLKRRISRSLNKLCKCHNPLSQSAVTVGLQWVCQAASR